MHSSVTHLFAWQNWFAPQSLSSRHATHEPLPSHSPPGQSLRATDGALTTWPFAHESSVHGLPSSRGSFENWLRTWPEPSQTLV